MARYLARHRTRAKQKWVVPVITSAVVVLFLGAAGAWIVTRAFTARDLLEGAVPAAGVIQDAVLAGDGDLAREQATELAKTTAEAAALTNDPIWRAAEIIPWAGANLTAVRVAAEVTDDLVTGVVLPATDFSLDEIKPKDGRIDIAAVREAAGFVDVADDAVHVGLARLDDLDAAGLVGPVRDGVVRLDDALSELAEITDGAQPALELLPGMLGESGPRHYLFLFQNNAESRGTGGNPASIAIITADNGHISMTDQASSRDFNNRRETTIIPLDEETLALYGTRIATQIQDVSLTPDFPTTAQIAMAYWLDTFGTPIDAVVSFDPIGLQRLLAATGPVTLATGDTISADNAVDLLLNGVYFRYKNPADQDVFFAAAAESVFSAVTSGNAETKPLIEAMADTVTNGNLMLWSAHPEEQAVIEPLPIAGRLEIDNAEATTFAAYFSDTSFSGGKMDYYMGSSVVTDVQSCDAEGIAATTTVTLTNLVPPEQVASLPLYISGLDFDNGAVDTNIVVYGPVGATVEGVALDGGDVPPDYLGSHLGRPVVKYRVLNAPGESHVVQVSYTGGPGDYGPVKIEGTPMVKPTERLLVGASCG